RVSILDSSFNPPTIAHRALAASQFPAPPLSSEETEYDGHMLLLSVTNADKKLKEGDATYEQRLEMMVILAKQLEVSSSDSLSPLSVCVAAIDEPTFAGNTDSQRDVELYFILGFDTVIRLFDPRFYGSDQERMKQVLKDFFSPSTEGGDGSFAICAKMDFLTCPPVNEYWKNGKVRMMELAEDLQRISSTQVRQAVKNGDKHAIGRLVPQSIVEYMSNKGLYAQA
ncbi:Nucleotidylyl transferase, partial [Serendipita vermifera]